MEFILTLKDGGIYECASNSESWSGCETCNYGSEYINEFEIYCTNLNIYFKVNQMYEFGLSTDYLLKLFLKNIEHFKTLTEEEFAKALEQTLRKEFNNALEKFEILPKGKWNVFSYVDGKYR